jgi:oligosaccharide reducing-end xylanase
LKRFNNLSEIIIRNKMKEIGRDILISFVSILATVFTGIRGIKENNGTMAADHKSSETRYPDLFAQLLGKSNEEVQRKINEAFNMLFYGDSAEHRIFYPSGPDMALIEDILHADVRTEGISYGMMIAVQLDRRKEFDKIWKWAKTYMQHQEGQRKYFFAWHCRPNGEILDSNSATDGEEWIVTALFFASARWGSGEGIYNYRAEAQAILDAMLTKTESSDSRAVVTNMFSRKEKQVVFVPSGEADDFTDPSYHLPHFYEVWSRCADKENLFWKEAAGTSREFLKKTINPVTGLAPDYAKFDGTPFDPWGGGNDNFQYDAWRVAMNVAADYIWLGSDKWEVEYSDRILTFFYNQGIKTYGDLFTLDGKPLGQNHSAGLVAMNACAALASTLEIRKDFVQELWNTSVPQGGGRYYDGLLYMLALLQVSGQFRMYETPRAVPDK